MAFAEQGITGAVQACGLVDHHPERQAAESAGPWYLPCSTRKPGAAANDVLKGAVQGIAELDHPPGPMNVDFC